MDRFRNFRGRLLPLAAALLPLLAAPGRADARVFFGLGVGVPLFGFGYPAYPPPVVYAPPPVVYAPPPVVYAPPPAALAGPVIARCVAPTGTCPLLDARPVGAPCGCPDALGRYVPGRAG